MLEYISVHEASHILGISDRIVRRNCIDGKLKAEKDGNAYSIELESVLDLLRSKEILVDSDIDPDIVRNNGHSEMSASPKVSDIDPDELFRKTAELLRTWSEYFLREFN